MFKKNPPRVPDSDAPGLTRNANSPGASLTALLSLRASCRRALIQGGAGPRRATALLPLLALAALGLLLIGCRTLPPLPKADLSAPGWVVHHGQAIWKGGADSPEIAGDLLLARDANGRTLVQFTKTPFPLVIAQVTSNAWQMEVPVEDRRFSRNGAPPQRILWFQFARAQAGFAPASGWKWTTNGGNWRIENPKTGEWLEGYLRPDANRPQ